MSEQNQKPVSGDSEEEAYESIKVWEPNSLNVRLEIGLSGVCDHCDTDLIENPTGDSRLQCPDCGYLAGLVIRYPSLDEGGEPADDPNWPKRMENWEIDDGRATFEMGIQGTHADCGDLVKNVQESDFPVPDICCSECHDQFGAAYQINTLIDPVNDINHLEGGDT